MMIERNLGMAERLLRLAGAIILAGWAVSRDSHDLLTPLALVAATALLLNFVFSRCYLWSLLGINSCGGERGNCRVGGERGDGHA
jgi:hypothetical protein